jgi:radical SAM protein (TIGR01212 family)
MEMYYNNLSDYYKNKFNSKVVKLSFNGGFTCPNRLNGGSGCIFCSGSDEYAGDKNKTLKEQYNEQKMMMDKKWPNAKYIAYFGSFTNTFDSVANLKKRFEEVLTFPNVIGLSIGTRSDSISDECLDYLIDLNKRTFLTIELGLQSMHNETLEFINRGHNLKNFDDCVKKLKDNNINVVVHIIDGLPNETEEMMLNTTRHLNNLNIDGIKIHSLYIIKNTPLELIYKKKPFKLLTANENINILCKQLEILNPNIVVHRLTGDPKKEELIAPVWSIKKIYILNGVIKNLKKNHSYQGKYYIY